MYVCKPAFVTSKPNSFTEDDRSPGMTAQRKTDPLPNRKNSGKHLVVKTRGFDGLPLFCFEFHLSKLLTRQHFSYAGTSCIYHQFINIAKLINILTADSSFSARSEGNSATK